MIKQNHIIDMGPEGGVEIEIVAQGSPEKVTLEEKLYWSKEILTEV